MESGAIESVLTRFRSLGLPERTGLVLVRAYMVQAPGYVDAVERAHARGDTVALRRAYHSLLGASANVGLSEITEGCRALRKTVIAASEPAADPAVAQAVVELVEASRAAHELLARWLGD